MSRVSISHKDKFVATKFHISKSMVGHVRGLGIEDPRVGLRETPELVEISAEDGLSGEIYYCRL